MSNSLINDFSQPASLAGVGRLDVELVGDVICPFTWLGKRRLEAAMEFVHGPSAVGWYPYQLNPTIPESGMQFDAYLKLKFGGIGAIRPVLDRLQAEGREVGIEYRFDQIERVPNTLPALKLLHVGTDSGLDVMPMAESMLSAYLGEGRDLGDADVLSGIARSHGLSDDEIGIALNDEAVQSEVLRLEHEVRETGVSGVPGFLMNRRLLLLGAQETSGIVAGFDRAMFGDANGEEIKAPLH